MTKITLSNVADLTQTTTAQNIINANSNTIQTAFDNTLSRDGTSPNQMGSNLDMNNSQILNLPSPASVNSPARLIDVTTSPLIGSVPPVGTSGAVVPLLNGVNTWSGAQTFNATTTFAAPIVLTSAKAGNQTWLEALIPATLSIANVSSVSPTGTIGTLGATRTLDNTLAGSQGAQAVSGFGINNNSTQIQTSFAGYFESRRYAGAGTALGVEINALNLGSVIAVDPYNISSTGFTPALWLSSGRPDVVSLTNTSVAIGIINNGTSHSRGIIFEAASLDNSGGEGVAIGLPVNYGMTWFASAANPVARIRSDATTTSMSIVFGNGTLNFQPANSITNAVIFTNAGVITANGLNLLITGASTATAGAASVLPSNPASYIAIQINGTNFKFPIYNP